MKKPTRAESGFTLVELAIVLAVVSILVSVVAPDFIEVARNDLAEQAAVEMTTLFDGAKWFYHESEPEAPTEMRWPGDYDQDYRENFEMDVEDCLTGDGRVEAGLDCTNNLLPSSALMNPWDQRYQMELVPSARALLVATNVPTSVGGVLRSYLPGGECSTPASNGGVPPSGQFCGAGIFDAVPAGYVRCCGVIPMPGTEASIASMGITQAACEGIGGIFISASQCDLYAEPTGSGCRTTTGDCDAQEVARGTRCSGKYCSTVQTVCCQTVQ
ncbi:MAG: type II secretion system protein [Myxococcota bacterium]